MIKSVITNYVISDGTWLILLSQTVGSVDKGKKLLKNNFTLQEKEFKEVNVIGQDDIVDNA